MNDYLNVYDPTTVRKTCGTCEMYMFDVEKGCNVCAGYKNGQAVKNDDQGCDYWDASFAFFCELEEKNQEYIKELDQRLVEKYCGTCGSYVNGKCFDCDSPHIPVNVKLSDEACENWTGSDQYIALLRDKNGSDSNKRK